MRDEGRGEENVEEVMNVGEAGVLMNPPIFQERETKGVGSSKLQHSVVQAIM